MLQSIQPLNPVALDLGVIKVYWYGLIIGMGAFIGYLLANREMIRRGLPKDLLGDLLVLAIPIAIVSARIYYVIFKWSDYIDQPLKAFAIWEGGLAIHGGLIGGVVTGIIFAKKRGVSFWKLADITAPSILLGQAVGRWGNFMNQEAFGGEVPRAFLENLYLPTFMIDQMYIGGAYYHPTFLYESLWSLAGVAILIYLRRFNMRRGELFLTYIIWYSFGRYFIEGLRTDSLMMFGLRTAQVISLVSIVGAVMILIYRRKIGLANDRYLDEEPKQKTKKKKRKK